jgi:hypothetical protein
LAVAVAVETVAVTTVAVAVAINLDDIPLKRGCPKSWSALCFYI